MNWNMTGECISAIYLCMIWIYSRQRNILLTLKNKVFQTCFLVTFCAIFSNIMSTVLISNIDSVPLSVTWIVTGIYFIATPLMGMVYFDYVVSIIYEEKPTIQRHMIMPNRFQAAKPCRS